MRTFPSSYFSQTLSTSTPLFPGKYFLFFPSPCGQSSWWLLDPPPHFSTALSSFPHRSGRQLDMGISTSHPLRCHSHTHTGRGSPTRPGPLPSHAGTKSHLTQTTTRNHKSPERHAHYHQSQGPSHMLLMALDRPQYKPYYIHSQKTDLSNIKRNLLPWNICCLWHCVSNNLVLLIKHFNVTQFYTPSY